MSCMVVGICLAVGAATAPEPLRQRAAAADVNDHLDIMRLLTLFPDRPLNDMQAWDALEAEHPALFAGLMVLWLRPLRPEPAPEENTRRKDDWVRDSFWI